MDPSTTIILSVLIFFVAALYSSVGHGGASGYLAVLSFVSLNQTSMASTALLLNIVVASLSLVAYLKAGFFRFGLTWPFVVASVPAAFLGGSIDLSNRVYFFLLAAILLFCAWRLSFFRPMSEGGHRPLSKPVALIVGALIGLLSGMVGVGGGIFLSPLVMLLHWANAKETAATSALFIVVNSIAGILGRLTRDAFDLGAMIPFLVAALLGGVLGSYIGANKVSHSGLARILAAVLVLAAAKLVLTWH